MSDLRARVQKAVLEHAENMEQYTLPKLEAGFLEGYYHAVRLLARDADVIAYQATKEDE